VTDHYGDPPDPIPPGHGEPAWMEIQEPEEEENGEHDELHRGEELEL
jgi:hypothetical protein